MDIIPFLSLIPTLVNERYIAVCKLQTKKGDGPLAEIWRDIMLDALIGSSDNFAMAARSFAEDQSICLIGPAALYQSGPRLMYSNLQNLAYIYDKTYGGESTQNIDWGFFAGTMFWARTETLSALSKFANFSLESVDGEYKRDGKLEHALERFFGLLARLHSGKIGLLQQRSVNKTDCCLLLVNSFESVGQAHIGDVMRQYARLETDVETIKGSGLFDNEYYVDQSKELRETDTNLIVHYLTQGTHRGLSPNKAFTMRKDICRYLQGRGETLDPFIFYLENGADEPRVSEVIGKLKYKKSNSYNTSIIKDSGLFDEEYYIQQCPELSAHKVDLIEHYVNEGTHSEVYPSRYFIPREYRALHPDVVEAGVEPFFHYITKGAIEGRRYRQTLRREQEESPFYRFQVLNSTLINWRSLEYTLRNEKLISIVIPVYGNAELTTECIRSILNSKVELSFEVICVDNGSDSVSAGILKEFSSQDSRIKIVSNPENYNFALGCNLGFARSSGSIVVFLNNDTTVTHGWLERLVSPLADSSIAAVQPKLVYPDGTIQCAGVVFSQKSPLGYPLYVGFAADESCVNRSRRVQAVTAACIGLRATDFIALKGFDPLFINGQEDVDLCLRLIFPARSAETSERSSSGLALPNPPVAHAPSRTCWYQAESLVYHHESKTPGRGKHIAINRRHFVDRWPGKLKADDYKYYAVDRYNIVNWTVDNEELSKQGIGISRPTLEKISVSRVYFSWDATLEPPRSRCRGTGSRPERWPASGRRNRRW